MKIAVVGTGYVGLVLGACLAENGNNVICVDKDASKVDMLKAGRMPIYEPGLEEIVRRNDHEERLTFTTDLQFNGGEFVGFLRDTPDISYFTVSDSYVGITQLTVQDMVGEPVPEPCTLVLLGAGTLGLVTRKRRA